MAYQLTPDTNPVQTMDSQFLAAVIRGEIDIHQLVRAELAGRGLDENARWIGFPTAKRLHLQKP